MKRAAPARSGFDPVRKTEWGRKAEELLEKALYQLRSDIDPTPAVSGAMQALLIDGGDAAPDEDLLQWDGE